MRREGDDEAIRSTPGGFTPTGQTPEQRREDEAHLRELQRARQARVAKLVVALAIVIILIVFVVQNSQRVPVDFVFVTRQSRLIWVMVVCAILGGIVGYLVGRPGKQVRLHRERDNDKDRKR